MDIAPGTPVDLGLSASGVRLFHVFEQEDIDAVRAALLSERPLLLRGEPGAGKSQLARAVAVKGGMAYTHCVVDARTEARDLKWREDLVTRLADAQLIGGLQDDEKANELRDRLDLINYVIPGPLWWGFSWEDAKAQAEKSRVTPPTEPEGTSSENGVVVLIDEIDKGGSDVPNGLLEALGAREFTPSGRTDPVHAKRWPLIVITTNEERRLPDAFLRRCVVHDMKLPTKEAEFIKYLVARGAVYYPDPAAADLLQKAAEQTWEDRSACIEARLRPLPGQAEYLDLLRAIFSEEGGRETPEDRLDVLSQYFLRKHADLR